MVHRCITRKLCPKWAFRFIPRNGIRYNVYYNRVNYIYFTQSNRELNWTNWMAMHRAIKGRKRIFAMNVMYVIEWGYRKPKLCGRCTHIKKIVNRLIWIYRLQTELINDRQYILHIETCKRVKNIKMAWVWDTTTIQFDN